MTAQADTSREITEANVDQFVVYDPYTKMWHGFGESQSDLELARIGVPRRKLNIAARLDFLALGTKRKVQKGAK